MFYKEYVEEERWIKIREFSNNIQTPSVIIDLEIIKRKFKELKSNFPYAKIYYAVKANPGLPVLKLLHDLGACFDVASIYELDVLLGIGVSPSSISYGNAIKKEKDIKYAYDKGIRLFATDSLNDIEKLSRVAPSAKVFFRILVEGSLTADWPLSRKFGSQTDVTVDLIKKAKELGLDPIGVSFHVGSQQRNIGAWDSAISKAKYIFDYINEHNNIKLSLLNMGGGFPAQYIEKTNDITTYSTEITRFINDYFEDEFPQVIFEPGRSLVADSGVLVSEVVLISKKSYSGLHRWVYVDAGKFNGLIETMNESIKLPIYTDKMSNQYEEFEEVVIAGPTCDSMDILYEDYKYKLPLSLKEGDKVFFLTTGAYTSSYAAVGFNGFPPIKTYYIE